MVAGVTGLTDVTDVTCSGWLLSYLSICKCVICVILYFLFSRCVVIGRVYYCIHGFIISWLSGCMTWSVAVVDGVLERGKALIAGTVSAGVKYLFNLRYSAVRNQPSRDRFPVAVGTVREISDWYSGALS